jgi:hypothetical protein
MKQPNVNGHPTAALRRLHRWRMALSGLVILIAGITLGAAGTVLVVRPARQTGEPPLDPGRAATLQLRRMQQVLGLTQDQVDKIEKILHDTFQSLEELRRDARLKIDPLFEAMKTGIDAVLTAEQREKWQEITESFDRFFHRGMRPGGRGGPGRGGPGDDFRGGPGWGGPGDDFRGGGRWFGPGDRSDANDPRRSGERGFAPFDPNGLRRRGGPRPDWQGQDFERRSPGRRFDANDSPPPPGDGDGPMDPGSP